MKCVSHQQASQLLHNKFIVVLGDSIQRAVYKDLVLLLQKEKYLALKQLKSKGEVSFEQDCLVEGGCLGQMHNGTEYREVRQFQSSHHLVRYYFVTRIYSRYMQSVLDDFRGGLKPDMVVVNSCVWDISRYNVKWVEDYKENLHKFFEELREILPQDTLVMWNLTMPLGKRIIGGFLVPEIEHKGDQMRYDVIEANFYSGTLADAYGMDVLDLHFQFRFSLQHRMKDGVHWNALAHRRITSLLLQHAAQAWGVVMTCPLTTVEHTDFSEQQQNYGNFARNAVACRAASGFGYSYPPPANYFSSNTVPCPSKEGHYNGHREEFFKDSLPTAPGASLGYFSFEQSAQPNRRQPQPQPQQQRHEAAAAFRPSHPPQMHMPVHRDHHGHGLARNGVSYRPPHHFQPYSTPAQQHRFVMRSRHPSRHYAPYTHHRPGHHADHRRYY
uniref:PC-esterase domain-containing protein 1A-like n=1 Tax=Centroberyx gerrardi TaxID=166262 RepID=UPI003AAD1517